MVYNEPPTRRENMFKAIKTKIMTLIDLVLMTNDDALAFETDARYRLIYLDGDPVVIDLKTDTLLPI